MKPTISNTKTEPYTPARAAALFATYADSDDPDVIGPDGFQQLCEDAQISMDGALPMILSWQLTSKEMMKISKAEWTAGTSALKCVSYTTSARFIVLIVSCNDALAEFPRHFHYTRSPQTSRTS